MHCQQFTLKYITFLTKSFSPNQVYHQMGLILLQYCVYNKHSIVPSAGPSIGEYQRAKAPQENFCAPGKMCWTKLKTIGHS